LLALVAGLSLTMASTCALEQAHAAPGDLDPSFGRGGLVRTELGSPNGASAIGLQPDGRIVVVGERSDSTLGVARYTADGHLDPSFADGGIGRAPNFQLSHQLVTRNLSIGNDGSVNVLSGGLVGQGLPRWQGWSVSRWQAGGAPDQDFGSDGVAPLPLDAAMAISSDPQGGLVVAGDEDDTFAVVRLEVDGSIDPGFGDGGVAQIDFGREYSLATDIVALPDGRFLVVGLSRLPGSGDALAAVRLLPDGGLDPSFGDGETTEFVVDPGSGWDFVGARVESAGQGDSLVGVAGALVRIDAAGMLTLDDRWAGLRAAGLDAGMSFAPTEDGLLVAGTATGCLKIEACGGSDFGLARYEPTGGVDTEFGAGGLARYDFGRADAARDIAIDANGRVLVAARDGRGAFLIARHLLEPGMRDADADGLPDAGDTCPRSYGPTQTKGCPGVQRSLTLERDYVISRLRATLSGEWGCLPHEVIRLYRRQPGRDPLIDRARARLDLFDPEAAATFERPAQPGRYYAVARRSVRPWEGVCRVARSAVFAVGRAR
jgi:uncharacterized delta-60 repeat protein